MLARENPYRSERVLTLRYRLQDCTREELLHRLDLLHGRGALLGPEGSGKTTLLEDMASLLEARGLTVHWLYLNRPHNQPDPEFWQRKLGPRDALLCDGAETLRRLDWWRLVRHTRRAGSFVITAHRPGRLPTLYRTHTSPALLAELVAELGEDAKGSQLDSLWTTCNGNLREALRLLYEVRANEGRAR